MGVALLQPYPIPDNKSGTQAIDYLSKRILALGAVQAGHFLVDCETYFSTSAQLGQNKSVVHILHDSEHPATTFSILENGAGKQVPLVADNLFDLLLVKMSPILSTKSQTKIESKGIRYEYSDFLIKVGTVTMMDNFKGILIEIEYRPCCVLAFCFELLREVLQGILGFSVPKEVPTYFQPQPIMNQLGQTHMHAKQNDIFEPIDKIYQYLEHFINYRKQNRYLMQVNDFANPMEATGENC